MFPANKIHVSTSQNERLAEIYDPVEGKIPSKGNGSLIFKKMEGNGFH